MALGSCVCRYLSTNMLRSRQSVATFIIFLAITAACGARGSTPPSAVSLLNEARLMGVEVFDTDPSTIARVMARYGVALRALLENGTPADMKRIAAKIRAGGEYAYVEPALVTYYEKRASYLTFDIVDQRDAERRMPFRPSPLGHYADPGGLIAAWQAYESVIFDLLDHGRLFSPPVNCPSFHCLGDPAQAELRSWNVTLSGVVDHVNELSLILRDDNRAEYRAAAAFLLAYAKDGDVVVASLLPALHDGNVIVRNNALRVLAEIALHHPEVDIPIRPMIEALSFPSLGDRNKAAAALYRLLERPDGARLRRLVAVEAGGVLLAMLRLAQPNNHDYAYKILRSISGKNYGERDYTAWQAWLSRGTAN